MAVDSLRDTFHKNWVEPDEIGLLLSAQSYRADITRAVKDIKASVSWLSLQEICNNKIGPGPHPKYGNSGHPCLKTKHVMGLIIPKSNFDWVPVHLAKPMKRFFVQDGNILLNITGAGSIGRVSIYYGNEQPLTNQHIARLDIKKAYDSAYICAFLSSWWGERLIEQGISGSTGQLNLVNDHIHTLPILIPDPKAQTYIGDKVRQAERLGDRSRKLEKEADSKIRESFPEYTVPNLRSKPRRIDSNLISPASLGPEYNRAMEGHVLLENCIPLSKTIIKCKCGDPIRSNQRVSGEYPYYGASGQIDIHNDYNFDGEYLIVAQDGSIGIAYPATGRFWANNHVWILSIDNKYDIDSIGAYLNKIYPYWKGMATGSVVPKVTSENLLQIPVPQKIALAKDSIGHWLRLASFAMDKSEKLTIVAKLLVEALIEGKLSEAELKAAQEGLEKGDTTLDREILDRLTRKGIDFPNEPPLFPDLDALYAALASLEATETTETANPAQNRVSNVDRWNSTPLPLASEAHETAYKVTAEVPE